jgi:hypothetical protein
MNQPPFAEVRLYSKIVQSIENMLRDPEEMREYMNLFSRLNELKAELMFLHPNIESYRMDVMRQEETKDEGEYT